LIDFHHYILLIFCIEIFIRDFHVTHYKKFIFSSFAFLFKRKSRTASCDHHAGHYRQPGYLWLNQDPVLSAPTSRQV
jgi:hypothetical protein